MPYPIETVFKTQSFWEHGEDVLVEVVAYGNSDDLAQNTYKVTETHGPNVGSEYFIGHSDIFSVVWNPEDVEGNQLREELRILQLRSGGFLQGGEFL